MSSGLAVRRGLWGPAAVAAAAPRAVRRAAARRPGHRVGRRHDRARHRRDAAGALDLPEPAGEPCHRGVPAGDAGRGDAGGATGRSRVHFTLREHGHALVDFRAALETDRNRLVPGPDGREVPAYTAVGWRRWGIAEVHLATGRIDAALAAATRSVETIVRDPRQRRELLHVTTVLARTLIAASRHDEAQAALRDATARADPELDRFFLARFEEVLAEGADALGEHRRAADHRRAAADLHRWDGRHAVAAALTPAGPRRRRRRGCVPRSAARLGRGPPRRRGRALITPVSSQRIGAAHRESRLPPRQRCPRDIALRRRRRGRHPRRPSGVGGGDRRGVDPRAAGAGAQDHPPRGGGRCLAT
ncbi:hypothetical protein C8E97_2715 [Saccharothrix australiensis]|uniref:Tetratricopeptide repeat protein n=1 Tax=Saccharothrix australiensis TaxID=2072 RepID=A0A495VY31_9PSEU|nr:hypothetical protein C8E97_2715 [Saccharothrix australiensis]